MADGNIAKKWGIREEEPACQIIFLICAVWLDGARCFRWGPVWCVNARGEMLLQRRRDNGCWAYPGGSVELDEVVEDAARREVEEEMGLRLGELELWNVFPALYGTMCTPMAMR